MHHVTLIYAVKPVYTLLHYSLFTTERGKQERKEEGGHRDHTVRGNYFFDGIIYG